MSNYYDKELQRIIDSNEEGIISIKVIKNIASTKWLDLNLDSIESFRAFLDIVEEDLKEREINTLNKN